MIPSLIDYETRTRLMRATLISIILGALVRVTVVVAADRLTPLGLSDVHELGYLALAPESFSAPMPDDAVRPDGVFCRVGAWKPGFGLGTKPDYTLTLTEFPDPNGKATYFRLRDYRAAVDDELLGGRQKP
jgi:hypothetical protein